MIISKFKLPETIFNPRCRQKYDTREEKRSEPHFLRILPRSWWPSSTSTTTPKARRLKAEALSKSESNNGKPGLIFLFCILHSTSIVQLALSGDSGLLNTFLSGPLSCFESFVLFELFCAHWQIVIPSAFKTQDATQKHRKHEFQIYYKTK